MPVASSTIDIEVLPNQTVTVSKQDTGFAITGDGEVYVQAFPIASQKSKLHLAAAIATKNTSTGLAVITLILSDRKMFCCNSIPKKVQ